MKEKIVLEVSNVGGILGKKTFVFSKDTLNLLEGPNASGKTSVAKALMAVLGIDNKVLHDISYNRIWLLEAKNLGIIPEKGGHRAGILHADATRAEVILKEDGVERNIIIEKTGRIIPDPNANANFLLVGVLTPNSWIYTAISKPGDIKNESIFKNYITKLSNKADKYEQAERILQEYYSQIYQLLNEVKKRKAMIPNLKKEIQKLEKEIQELKQKKDQLIKMIGSNSQEKAREISKLKKDLEKLEKEKEDLKEEIRKSINYLEHKKNEVKKLEKEIDTLNRRREELRQRKKEIELELSKPFDISSLEQEIEQLQNERSKLQALADLYYIALDNIEDENSTCPLCGSGILSPKHLEEHLNITKERITKIEKRLREIVKTKIERENYLRNLEDEHKFLEDEIKSIQKKIGKIIQKLDMLRNELNKTKENIAEKERKYQIVTKRIRELNDILRKENPELIAEIDKITKVLEEKEKVLTKKQSEYITSGYIEIYGKSLELNQAQEVLEHLLRSINNARKYALKRAEDIRQEAIKQFNTMIQEVLKRIGFSEFKRIYLDKNYILNVQYVSPEGEVKIIQPYALSESERVSVALVLMLALNKVYRENINYIVIDNMYEYFDEYRTEEILKLLLEYAKQENVTIILTRTTSEESTLQVKVVE